MPAPIDITGQRFGRLVARKFVRSNGRARLWLFDCDCGKQHVTAATLAKTGVTKSCGCYQSDRTKEAQEARPEFLELFKSADATECLICPSRRKDGYPGRLTHNGERLMAHVFACIYANGEKPGPDYHAAHECGNGTGGCMNPHHMKWKKVADNMADKARHGTQPRGEKVSAAKLTENAVVQIKQQLLTDKPKRRIADEFGVSESLICMIAKGKRWAHIKATNKGVTL